MQRIITYVTVMYLYPSKIRSENESNFGYASSGHSFTENLDMRIRGYFSKSNGVCEQSCLGNAGLCDYYRHSYHNSSVKSVKNLAQLPCLALGALEKLRKANISFVMSVRPSIFPHGTTGLPLYGFSLNLIFVYLSKICPGNSIFIRIGQE